MSMTQKNRIAVLLLLLTLSACKKDNAVDSWHGKWIGPEGTYLEITPTAPDYKITINSLDGPAEYTGTKNGDAITFIRNSTTEYIRAGTGRDTGMKWLLEKQNCLVIKTGEGFCRD